MKSTIEMFAEGVDVFISTFCTSLNLAFEAEADEVENEDTRYQADYSIDFFGRAEAFKSFALELEKYCRENHPEIEATIKPSWKESSSSVDFYILGRVKPL